MPTAPNDSVPGVAATSNSSLAHRVLLNDDLLTIIFETFNLQTRKDMTTCASAARVCRAWDRPASCQPWRVISNPLPLYNILDRVPGNMSLYCYVRTEYEKYLSEVTS